MAQLINFVNTRPPITVDNKSLKPYLATVTSAAEAQFIKEKVLLFLSTGTVVYISGDRTANLNQWVYSSGPEAGELIYTHSSSRCMTYCNWGYDEDQSVYSPVATTEMDFLTIVNGVWTNARFTPSSRVIIEYGGLNDPQIPSAPMTGGDIVISNLVPDESQVPVAWNINDISVKVLIGASTYLAPIKFTGPSSSITVTLNAITDAGEVSISMTDSKRTYSNGNYQYQLPYANIIYPASGSRNLISTTVMTISGSNFGSDPSKIIVKFGVDSTVCKNVAIVTPGTAISCTLGFAASDSKSLLPLVLSVNGLTTGKLFPAVYDPIAMRAITIHQYKSLFTEVQNMIKKADPIDFNAAYHGAVLSGDQNNFLRFLFPFDNSNQPFQGISGTNSGGNPNFKFNNLGGPNDGVAAFNSTGFHYTLLNKVQTGGVSTSTVTLTWDPSNKVHFSGTSSARKSEFVNHGRDAIQGTNLPFLVDTAGGKIVYNVEGSTGFKYSARSFKIDNVLQTTPITQLSQNTLEITIPEGTGASKPMTVNIEKFALTGSVGYLPPSIASVSPIYTLGGIATMFGASLGKSTVGMSVSFGDSECTGIKFVENHKSFSCVVPAGTGRDKVISITVGGQTSTFNSGYSIPAIKDIVQTGNSLAITGTSFGVIKTDSIITPSSTITSLSTTTAPEQVLVATFPANTKNGPITVVVKEQLSIPLEFKFTPVLTTITYDGTTLTLTGSFLNLVDINDKPATVSILVGSNQCTGASTSESGDSMTLTCTPPSITGADIPVTVTIDSLISNTLTVSQVNPTITSVTQTGTKLSIFGSGLGDATAIKFNDISVVPISVLTNPAGLLVDIPTNALNGDLTVVLPTKNVNYKLDIAPIVTEVSSPAVTGDKLTITGSFFNTADFAGNQVLLTIARSAGKAFTNIVVASSTKITCTIEAGTGSSGLTVTSGSKSSQEFTFYYARPTITSLKQSEMIVSISGSNFGSDASKISVKIADITLSFELNDNVIL
eukprot:gene19047-22800_t